MEFLVLINLIVAFQAIFLAIHFLAKKKGEKLLNYLLAILLLAFGLVSTNTYISLSDFGPSSNTLQSLANHVLWFVAPSFYLYVIYHQKPINGKTAMWHLAPYVPIMVFDVITQFPQVESFLQMIALVQMIIYLALSIKLSIKHYQVQKTFYSWVIPVLVSYSLILIVNVVFKSLEQIGQEVLSRDALQAFTVLLSFPVFYTSYREMNNQRIGLTGKGKAVIKMEKSKSSSILDDVKTFVEEQKGYRNKNLTLQLVSEETGHTTKSISQVVNNEIGNTFSDYINMLRIEEAKRELINPENNHLSIAGIADESGFTSVSRFNHLFKKHTGMTPKAYKNSQIGL